MVWMVLKESRLRTPSLGLTREEEEEDEESFEFDWS